MLHPQNADVPLDLNHRIGLVWFLGSLSSIDMKKSGPVAQHDGATRYQRSQMIVLPEQKLGVVVLSTSATAGEVVGNVASEALKLAFEAKSGIRQHAQKQVKPRTGSLP
jgi:ABC-type polysaccharide transport system permease subunit